MQVKNAKDINRRARDEFPNFSTMFPLILSNKGVQKPQLENLVLLHTEQSPISRTVLCHPSKFCEVPITDTLTWGFGTLDVGYVSNFLLEKCLGSRNFYQTMHMHRKSKMVLTR